MHTTKEVTYQCHRDRDVEKIAYERWGALDSQGATQEEKDYQRLANDKLKSAAKWDNRDSKRFSIG